MDINTYGAQVVMSRKSISKWGRNHIREVAKCLRPFMRITTNHSSNEIKTLELYFWVGTSLRYWFPDCQFCSEEWIALKGSNSPEDSWLMWPVFASCVFMFTCPANYALNINPQEETEKHQIMVPWQPRDRAFSSHPQGPGNLVLSALQMTFL